MSESFIIQNTDPQACTVNAIFVSIYYGEHEVRVRYTRIRTNQTNTRPSNLTTTTTAHTLLKQPHRERILHPHQTLLSHMPIQSQAFARICHPQRLLNPHRRTHVPREARREMRETDRGAWFAQTTIVILGRGGGGGGGG